MLRFSRPINGMNVAKKLLGVKVVGALKDVKRKQNLQKNIIEVEVIREDMTVSLMMINMQIKKKEVRKHWN